MSLELRAIDPAQLEAYANQISRTFTGSDSEPGRLERLRRQLEFDRTLAVFEAGEVVATAGAFSFRMTTVGDRLAAAGVSRVSVRPTHRRQGLLTRMMRRQLDDVHERGEPLAILWASETPIYGRFGYGLASYAAELTIPRGLAFRRPVDLSGRVRLVGKEFALATIPALVDRIAPSQPGMINRDLGHWQERIEDEAALRRSEPSDAAIAVCDLGEGPSGYVIYRIRVNWSEGAPASTVIVSDLLAADPASYAVLWRYLLDLDLVRTLRAPNRPPTEPLRHLLLDPRAPRIRPSDGLWRRLVDVPRALAGRRYSAEGRLTLQVRDEFCPWNQGIYELEAGLQASRCEPIPNRPELSLDCADLSAAYLGSNSFAEMAWAGRVEEHVPGALARADAMFAAPRPAWCPFHF